MVNLAEIYDLEVKKLLAKYSQIPETVIPASAAEMFSHFEEISSKLFIHCTTFLLATKVLTTKQLASINRHSSVCSNSQAARDGVGGLPIMSTVTPACRLCAMTRLPMSLSNMSEGCRVFIRLGSCRMEVVGRQVDECREHR